MSRSKNYVFVIMFAVRENSEYQVIGAFDKKGDAVARLQGMGMRYSRRKDIFYDNSKKKWYKIIDLKRNTLY